MKIDKLAKEATFLRGGVAYSLIDKLVNYRSDIAEGVLQSNRDQKIENMDSKIENIDSNVNNLVNFAEHLNVIKECSQAYGNRNNVVILDRDLTLSQLNEIKTNGGNILTRLNELKSNVDWNLEGVYEQFLELLKNVDGMIENVSNNNDITNKFVGGFSDFFQSLESLSILQHSILLDILMFLLLIFTVINILSALFGNEIIKYFNLETRFPGLSLLFKVRSSLQRYYLMWNVFVLIFVCMFGIGINIVVLVLSLS